MITLEPFLAAGVGLLYGVLGALLIHRYRISPRSYGKAKKRFFQELDTRWELGFIKNIEDIISLLHAISKTEKSTSLDSTEIADLLGEYLLQMTSAKIEEVDKEKFSFFEQLVDEQRIEEPFSVLPDRERGFAIALRRSIENNNRDDALQQLNELVDSMGVRLSTAENELEKNRIWTRVGAFLGGGAVIITIILFLFFR